MTNKKNRFCTFIFSLIPGAGEMYMGFFRHGISVMGLFFLTITITAFLNIGPLLFLLPIIWFYSFFYVHSLKNMPDEEFYALEDDFIFPFGNADYNDINLQTILKKYQRPIAFVIIIIGLCILWNNLLHLLYWLLPSALANPLYTISNQLPQILVGVLLVCLGFYLIAGKKKTLHEEANKNLYENSFGYQKDAHYFQEPLILSGPDESPAQKTDEPHPDANPGKEEDK